MLLSWKNSLSCTRRRNLSRFCLNKNSSVFLAMGKKLRPLLRTDFSGSESGKVLDVVTTASCLSLRGSSLLGGPARLMNFCASAIINIEFKRAWSSAVKFCHE